MNISNSLMGQAIHKIQIKTQRFFFYPNVGFRKIQFLDKVASSKLFVANC